MQDVAWAGAFVYCVIDEDNVIIDVRCAHNDAHVEAKCCSHVVPLSDTGKIWKPRKNFALRRMSLEPEFLCAVSYCTALLMKTSLTCAHNDAHTSCCVTVKYGIIPKMVKILRTLNYSSLSRSKDFEFSLSSSLEFLDLNFLRFFIHFANLQQYFSSNKSFLSVSSRRTNVAANNKHWKTE